MLTPGEASPTDTERLVELLRSIGAVPLIMDAAVHDQAVAVVSHLPQLVASALAEAAVAHPGALELAAGGFRDLTRVALSDPGWWADILVANGREVAAAARRLAEALTRLAETVEQAEVDPVADFLARARAARASLAAPVALVGVVLEDEPGEIARVGHALERSGVDLRDLQLRHATHGGGGVLTLSVRSRELPALRRALRAEGFKLLDSTA